MSTPTPWGSPSAPQDDHPPLVPMSAPPSGPERPRQAQDYAGCVRPFIVIAILAAFLFWLFAVNHETNHGATPTDSSTAVSDTSTDGDTATATDDSIEAGDCLSVDGPQPTGTGTVDVSNIARVDCGSSSAQYKVVGVEPFTTDMNSCATDYPQSTAALLDQEAYFSEVYCVVDASS
jgi:hypothetical protein